LDALRNKVGRFIWNRVATKHQIDENTHPELPTVKALELPQLTLASSSRADSLKRGMIKELPKPPSVPPKDAA
jgi:hypothetical protein